MNNRVMFGEIKMVMKRLALLMLIICSQPLFAVEITAHVTGFENSSGRLRFAMFTKAREDSFPVEFKDAEYVKDAGINNGEATVSISNVAAGVYAVFLFHDSNNNGVMDHKWYGPPEEAFAYYKLYKVKMMPPDFDDVSFQVSDTDIQLEIPLQIF